MSVGYFDSVKAERKTRPNGVEGSNVIPITRSDSNGLHPYAHAVVDAELGRLDQCRATPLNHPPHWDETTYEVACNLIELGNSPWSGYTLTQARNDLEARAPRDADFDIDRIEQKWESALGKVGSSGRPQPVDNTLPSVTVLDQPEVPDLAPADEDAFWGSREILTHLHTFARARRVSPWATLGVALARIITATPHQVVLPPIIGSKASLNLFVGIVGTSGAGKGGAEGVAADALDVGYLVSHNAGSGEGIAHGYKHRVKGELHWNDDAHAVLFSVPEIDSLAAQGDRKGATLMPQLRSGWTGEQLGFGYADPTKRIIVEAHQYRLCMVAGIQPGRAGCLLDDSDGGTPQRFLWLPADDPDAPRQVADAPPQMAWWAPPTSSLVTIGGLMVEVCETARETIIENRYIRLRGSGEALDGHALLCQLKTAAALGIAEGRYSVTNEDWQLAEVIMRKSAATRSTVTQALKAKAHEANYGRAEAEASRAVLVAEKVADVAVKRVCKRLMRHLNATPEEMARNPLRHELASRDRSHFDEAIERLVEAGQIVHEKGPKGDSYRTTAK